MSKYKFETEEFGLSDQGIHLLRSRYNYQTIAFEEIRQVRIERSRMVNNWIVLFALGIALVAFAAYCVVALIEAFNDPDIHRIYIEEIIVPVLPFLVGLFMVYSSLRNGIMLVVFLNNGKKKRLPLKKLHLSGHLDAFVSELKNSLKKKGTALEMAALVM